MPFYEDYPTMPTDGETAMTLTRSGVFITSKGKDCIDGVVKEVRGERGILNVMGKEFHTIERTSTMRLPVKVIECTMIKHESKGQCFYPRADGEYGHGKRTDTGAWGGILIHAASFPHHLSGCLAPGRTILTTGIGESREALDDIFTALGGFGEGRKVYLTVKN